MIWRKLKSCQLPALMKKLSQQRGDDQNVKANCLR